MVDRISMDIAFLVTLAVAVISSTVLVLRVVAPKTSTTVDDSVLEKLEALEALLIELTAKK